LNGKITSSLQNNIRSFQWFVSVPTHFMNLH
jgi:hypothetical protein